MAEAPRTAYPTRPGEVRPEQPAAPEPTSLRGASVSATSALLRRRGTPGRLLLAVALVGALALAGCSPGGAEPDDQTLTIAAVDNGDLERLRELSEVFLEDRPGADIEWVAQEENELRETISTDVGTESGRFDVVTVGTYEAQVWVDRDLLSPLTEMPEGFDPDAFLPDVRDALSHEGTLQAAPFYGESTFTMYRTDLFDELGLKMPDAPTWDDVSQAAAVIAERTDLAGVCLRGKTGWGENAALLTAMAHSYGARWFDEDWRAELDSPAWRAAMKDYLALAENAPRDVADNGYLENLALFQEGRCGIWVDATSAASFITDPEQSKVADDVGFALAPTTPEGRPANWLWAWSLAIPASSPDSQLAKEFVTWATSQEYAELVADEHGWAAAPPGTRSDLYDNADYLSAAPFADLVLRSIETADIDEPTTVPVPYQGVQYVDEAAFQSLGTAVGEQVNRAVKGELSLDEALENSQWVADNVIERTRLLAEQRESD